MPTPGYTGPASYQVQADDGYGTSALTTISVTVSAAPLISLDFQERAPNIDAGGTLNETVIGDFADEQGVVLPSSYLTFQILDPSVATVSTRGQLSAIADGTTVLLASSHGLLAATAVSVGTAADRTQQLLVKLGLDDYPQALTLAAYAGSRQLKIDLAGEIDMTTASTGTKYFVSDSSVITVTADGLVLAGNEGIAQITVINGPSEKVIPVKVEPPQTGSIVVGPAGAIVQGPDGSTVAVGPGALLQGATVGILPLTQANLPMPLPSALHFAGAFQLNLGGQRLALPAQIAVPVAPGLAPGTPVLFYRADQVPDGSGNLVPAWMEVEDGVVGSDGFARSSSPPYDGIQTGGSYIVATLDTLKYGLVSGYLQAVAGFALGASSYLVLGSLGGGGTSIGAYVNLLAHFVVHLPSGPNSVRIVEVPPAGQNASAAQVTIDVDPNGQSQYTATVTTSTINNGPPQISSVSLETITTGGYRLVLNGQGFGTSTSQLSVLFQLGGRDLPGQQEGGKDAVGTPVSATDTKIEVDIPAGVPLGSALISVIRQIPNLDGQPTTLESDSVPIAGRSPYIVTAQNATGFVAILDGQATVPDPQNPGQVTPNPDYGKLVSTIDVGAGSRPTYLALTSDDTRAYVILAGRGAISVIDTVALHKVQVDSSSGDIALPSGASPFEITIDQNDEFAYISDKNNYIYNGQNYGVVYVVNIDPESADYNHLVRTIRVSDDNQGLRGLALNSDGNRLFVASPNDVSYFNAKQSTTVGHIEVIDTSAATSATYWQQFATVTADQSPFGVSATTDPNVMIYTNYLNDDAGFGIIRAAESNAPTATQIRVNLGLPGEPFDVSNVRSVVITPDGKFAFVAGWSFPDQNIPSHNSESPADDPGGSTIGIIQDPLGPNPKLVAATRSIPNGFPPDLAVSPDGEFLYATFPNVPVANSARSALFVYDINAIAAAIKSTNAALLDQYAIDDLVNGTLAHNVAIDVNAAYAVDPNNTGFFPALTVYDPNHVRSAWAEVPGVLQCKQPRAPLQM